MQISCNAPLSEQDAQSKLARLSAVAAVRRMERVIRRHTFVINNRLSYRLHYQQQGRAYAGKKAWSVVMRLASSRSARRGKFVAHARKISRESQMLMSRRQRPQAHHVWRWSRASSPMIRAAGIRLVRAVQAVTIARTLAAVTLDRHRRDARPARTACWPRG